MGREARRSRSWSAKEQLRRLLLRLGVALCGRIQSPRDLVECLVDSMLGALPLAEDTGEGGRRPALPACLEVAEVTHHAGHLGADRARGSAGGGARLPDSRAVDLEPRHRDLPLVRHSRRACPGTVGRNRRRARRDRRAVSYTHLTLPTIYSV